MLKKYLFILLFFCFYKPLFAYSDINISNKQKNNRKIDKIIKNKYFHNKNDEIVLILTKKYFAFINILIFIFIITLIFFIFNQIVEKKIKQRKDEKIVDNEKKELKNRETEKKFRAISHFLKNPLQSIVSTTERVMDSLEEKNFKDKKVEDKLNMIIKDVGELSKKIDYYLYSLKSEFNLNDVIKASIFFMEKNFKRENIKIEYKEKLEFDYYENKGYLEMILTVLFENAITALKTFDSKQRIVTIELIEENSNYILFVKDNGKGIPKDMLPNKIFEKGITSKKKKSGGLGLYIVKKIITDDFKGKIEAYNDNGAIFKITLPCKK